MPWRTEPRTRLVQMVALFVFGVAGECFAQSIVFAPQVVFPAGAEPTALIAADFDGDGDTDLAVSDRSTGAISIHLNNGGGWLPRYSALNAGDMPRLLCASDLDQDGDQDLAVANFSESVNTVTVFLNQGDGVFGAGVAYSILGRSRQVISVDIDQDGWLDLVVASNMPSGVEVLHNLGGGVFGPSTSYNAESYPGSVDAGDLNNDGWPDIIATNRNSNSVSVLMNDGAGLLLSAVNYAVGLTPKSGIIGDFDQDGDGDVAVANGGDSTVSVLFNNGAGALQQRLDYPTGSNPHQIVTADFDGDGWLDLATADIGPDDTVSVLRNTDGAGTFSERFVFPVGFDPAGLVATDLDGDGAADIVTANAVDNTISVLASTLVRADVFNLDPLRSFLLEADTQRVDLVDVGDLNQLQQSHGWDHGWQKALAERFGMYATELLTPNSSLAPGYLYSPIGLIGASVGAPAPLQAYLDPGAGNLSPLRYAYLDDAGAQSGQNGMSIEALSPIDVNANLRFHYTFGTFDIGVGSFQPIVRLGVPPWTPLAKAPPVNPVTGHLGDLQNQALDLPAATRPFPLQFLWNPNGGGQIDGPFFGLAMRVENLDRQSGASLHTLLAQPGASMRDLALDLQQASDVTLSNYFSLVRQLQTDPRRVLIRINTGWNDLSDTNPSVGPIGSLPSNDPTGFEDNLRGVVNRINEIWSLNNWPAGELFYVFAVTHELPQPFENTMLAYRVRAISVAGGLPNAAAVNLDLLATPAEMTQLGWYDANDPSLLTQAGYEGLAARELDASMKPAPTPNSPDLTGDGVVNGADLASLLIGWGLCDQPPTPCPQDLNLDGIVNGADLATLLINWGPLP